MAAKLTRAGDVANEAATAAAFHMESLSPQEWSSEPGGAFAPHTHAYHKVSNCLRGSITFTLASGEVLDLHPGDRLDLEPQTLHSAVAGRDGATCVEAARQ